LQAPESRRPARGGPSGTTLLSLRGDANPVADPAPYRVATVRKVLWHMPGLAPVIVWLDRPLVLGGIAAAVCALLLWTLWPPRRRPAGQPGRHCP